jgi:hypothetical protein
MHVVCGRHLIPAFAQPLLQGVHPSFFQILKALHDSEILMKPMTGWISMSTSQFFHDRFLFDFPCDISQISRP